MKFKLSRKFNVNFLIYFYKNIRKRALKERETESIGINE